MQRKQILGAWQLASFEARDVATGIVRHPLGAEPSGLILYTDDGYMSAQLATTPSGADYIAYGGRFHLDEQTSVVHHEVTMSMMPELLAAPAVPQCPGGRRSAHPVGHASPTTTV